MIVMPKTITSVQCARCGYEVSLAGSPHMYVVKLHECKLRQGMVSSQARDSKICPTCKTPLGHSKEEKLMKTPKICRCL